MNSSPKTRHRGTWSTFAMVLVFSLGVCTLVFGIFNLATDIPLGLSAIVLGIGLILPGIWWLRWYQKPQLLRSLLPASIVLFIPGAIGLAASMGSERAPVENIPPIVSQSPSPKPLLPPETPTSSPTSTSSIVPPFSSSVEPSSPASSSFEIPTTEVYQAPTPIFIPPVTLEPTPEPQPSITESVSPETASPSDTPAGTPEESTELETPSAEVTEQPDETPTDPFLDLFNQFFQ